MCEHNVNHKASIRRRVGKKNKYHTSGGLNLGGTTKGFPKKMSSSAVSRANKKPHTDKGAR